jgi:hypothetical protein
MENPAIVLFQLSDSIGTIVIVVADIEGLYLPLWVNLMSEFIGRMSLLC